MISNPKYKVIFSTAALLLLTTHLTSAIVIRHDVKDKKYRVDNSFFPPLATFYVDGAHGTLINSKWVLTAAHASFCINSSSSVLVNGTLRRIKDLYVHPNYTPGESHDIALVELVDPVLDVVPANIGSSQNELNENVWFVGIGGTGNGMTGQTIDNAENKGVLRAAQNKVSTVNGPLIGFRFDRDNQALPLEGVSGAGDSGGPAFLLTEKGYELVGISSRFINGSIGKYGITEIYTRVSYFNSWITAIMTGDKTKKRQLSLPKLTKLPAGLNEQNLAHVCEDITFKSNT